MLSNEEIDKVRQAVEQNKFIPEHVHYRSDNMGSKSKVCLWNHPGEDIPGVLVRLQKTAGTLEEVSTYV